MDGSTAKHGNNELRKVKHTFCVKFLDNKSDSKERQQQQDNNNDEDEDPWYDVGDEKAIDKAARLLREEGQPKKAPPASTK